MALRAMYKGFKKVLAPLIINRPGELAIDQDVLNAELNSVFFPRSEQELLGAKSLAKNSAVSEYKNGLTLTANSDGSVTVNGTATADTAFLLYNPSASWTSANDTVLAQLKGKEIIVSGGHSNHKQVIFSTRGTGASTIDIVNNGGDTKGLIANGSTLEVYWVLRIVNGETLDNERFYPMISLDGGAYAPYAKTNQQLTADVTTLNGSASDQKTAINAIITAATGAADFAAFKTAMGAITPVTRSIQVTPETREEITEPVEEVKKTTRKKSTAKADTEKEGDK